MYTFANNLGVVGKVHTHTAVKHIQVTLPQTIITVSFTVLGNTAIDLVDILESSLLHHGAQQFAAHTAGAVRYNLFVLQLIVFATV